MMLPTVDHDVLLLQFPFELQTLPPYRWYQSVTVCVAFADEAIMAIDIRLLEPAMSGEDDRPLIDVRGIGRAQLAWDVRSASATGLRPHSHVVQVILDAPAGITVLAGTLNAEAMISRQRLGVFDRTVATAVAPEPFTLEPLRTTHAAAGALPGDRSGPIRVEICRRLANSWKDLADYVGVRPDERGTFEAGREPSELWDWLEFRDRLGEMPAALRAIGRSDLADIWSLPSDVGR